MAAEIKCEACGEVVLARREAIYDGFKKIGEMAICTACGHRHQPDAELEEAAAETRPSIFGDDDRPEKPAIFDDSEFQRCCRYCKHYILSRFDQRCGLTQKTVEATDLCFDFERREEDAGQ